MQIVLTYPILIAGSLLSLFFFAFAWTSYRERERRAGWISVFLGFSILALSILASLLPFSVQQILLLTLALLVFIALILFLLPIGQAEMSKDPQSRFDERDIPFSRRRLVPGSPEYQDYYRTRPELRSFDEMTRTLPGLLSLDAHNAHPLVFRTADASFSITEALSERVDGRVAPSQTAFPAETYSTFSRNGTSSGI